ncbi:MAG TPA: glycosyltransferase family 1 protein [Roseiflexaceae bacterium]|nr:glycosyltransferase family 1 protein [Roseiflexaceae bacterium]
MSAPAPPGALAIGIDCRFIHERWDGIGRYSYSLLAGLCGMAGAHRIVAFVDAAHPNRLDQLNGFVRSGKLQIQPIEFSAFHPRAIWRWRVILREHPVDRFYMPYHVWAPVRLPCPLISMVYDQIFDRYPRYMPHGYLWPLYKLASYLAIRRSDRIITCSHATERDIVRFTGVDGHKITVIPLGVDARFRPVHDPHQRQIVRTRYGLPEKFVLALGTRRPHKNINRLVAGFAHIAGDVPQTLVIVGPTGGGARLRSRTIAALTRQRRIIELQYVEERDLAALYSMAELFVQPSIIEGFGLPVLEAMACGCPVACSNTTSLPEVAGDAALLFDPISVPALAAALRQALLSSDLRHDLSQRGLRRAGQFSWEQTVATTMIIFQR